MVKEGFFEKVTLTYHFLKKVRMESFERRVIKTEKNKIQRPQSKKLQRR